MTTTAAEPADGEVPVPAPVSGIRGDLKRIALMAAVTAAAVGILRLAAPGIFHILLGGWYGIIVGNLLASLVWAPTAIIHLDHVARRHHREHMALLHRQHQEHLILLRRHHKELLDVTGGGGNG